MKLEDLLKSSGVPLTLIINDRGDVALAVEADGVAVVSAIVAADDPAAAAGDLIQVIREARKS